MQDCTEHYAFQSVKFHCSLTTILFETIFVCLVGMCVRSASINSTHFGGELGKIIM
jgi:hypothetical protein